MISIIDRTIALCLSDDDETPDQINCFLFYNLTLCHFTHLQSLSLYYLHCEIVMCKWMNEYQQFHNLVYLKFSRCEFRQENKTICCLLSRMWSLPKLTYCYLDVYFEEQKHGSIIPISARTGVETLYPSKAV